MRALVVHARALDADAVAREAAAHRALLLIDALDVAVPAPLRAPLERTHAEAPFANLADVGEALRDSKAALRSEGLELWRALTSGESGGGERGGGVARAEAGAIAKDSWAALAWWRRGDAGDSDARPPSAGATPFGDRLLHAAAFAGDRAVAEALIDAGADVDARGANGGKQRGLTPDQRRAHRG